MPARGLLITFEGTEGGGKSTQIKLLAERLQNERYEVEQFREPGGTPLGEEIRNLLKYHPAGREMDPKTELLLVNAARAQLVRDKIDPAIEAGKIVLCDRFFDSSEAYQGYGRGMDLHQVRAVIGFAVGNTIPDLTLYLRIPLEVSEARRQARLTAKSEPTDRFEQADRDFFRRVEEGFEAIAEAEDLRVHPIDATRTVSEVQDDIWNEVEPLLSRMVRM